MLKTAECVTPSHPDKMCDRISDAVLDHYLAQDSNSRVAIETVGSHGRVLITGEVTSGGTLDIHQATAIVNKITNTNDLSIELHVVEQSPEIANGVDTGGAGDQGIMIGYACNDNEEMMPNEYYLARSLAKFIYEKHPYDGKTQVTTKNGVVDTIVASFQNVPKETLHELITDWYAEAGIVDEDKGIKDFTIHANPAGDWSQGGFDADAGLTGRKLAVDNYGPSINIGGGAFSGKDSTKVDRSGAYMARYVAVDLLRKHEAKIVKVALAYAIGVAEPVMVTATVVSQEGDVNEVDVTGAYDFTPQGIMKLLDLKNPQFEETARWGHFGNGFEWDL